MGRRSKSEILEVLRGIPLFAHLPKSELREVAKLCFEKIYETDHVILKQLEEAQQMVAIISGRARVTRDGQAVATVGAGDVVGEMALIDGLRRSAAVVAETTVEGIVLHRTAFLKLLDKNPSMAKSLLLAQTARLREADRKLGALG
jgi:CRP/FNR family cyclic AMP-dependent transcriptional regulator